MTFCTEKETKLSFTTIFLCIATYTAMYSIWILALAVLYVGYPSLIKRKKKEKKKKEKMKKLKIK